MSWLGVDVGGTNLKAALLGDAGDVLGTAEAPTRADGSVDAVLSGVSALASELAKKNPGSDPLRGACLGIPGPVDRVSNTVVMAPNLGWMRNTDVAKPASRLLGVPVTLANDATCAGVGEAYHGGGRSYRSFLLLTLGTAVGAALVQDGRPFDGFGRYGGELGHIPLVHGGLPCSCGIDGCFEQYGSATALARIARERAKGHPWCHLAERGGVDPDTITAADVVAAAAAGERCALAALDEYTTYLAKGTAGLVNIFRPAAVVYAGGLAQAGELLRAPLQEKLFRYACASEVVGAPDVVMSENPAHVGALGAARIASQEGGR